MVPTVEEGKRALLGAQNTGPTTNEMAQAPVAEDEGIPWRDRPRALPTRRGLLFRHWSIPNAKGRTDGPTAGGTTASLRDGSSRCIARVPRLDGIDGVGH